MVDESAQTEESEERTERNRLQSINYSCPEMRYDGGHMESVIHQTLSLVRQIFSRTDEGELCPEMQNVRYPFETAFYNPHLISRRSRLDTSGLRPASLKDIFFDFRRVFVLYADILVALKEFCVMKEEDRMAVAKSRFAPYYWWLTANWAVRANCQGAQDNLARCVGFPKEIPQRKCKPKCNPRNVCYANGTYFPADVSQQAFPDSNGVSAKSLTLLKEPLEELQLDEDEMIIGGLFVIFADNVPKLSPEGLQQMETARTHFMELLTAVCSRNRNEFMTANRVANITALLSGITNLTYLSSDNLELSELLHVIEFPDWTEELRQHRYKRNF